jgi:hypothetical protein
VHLLRRSDGDSSVVEGRREQAEAFAWAVPGLAIAGQAFLLAILMGHARAEDEASKDKHRELLRTDDTLFELVDPDAGLVELAQVQLAYREVGHSNPWYAQSLAHWFGRLLVL